MRGGMVAILTGVATLTGFSANAGDVSLYVSLQDDYLNGRIAQMAVVSNLPTMRRPYVVSEVQHYLPRLSARYPGLAKQIADGLRRYSETGLARAEVTAALERGDATGQRLANARGEFLDSQFRASANAQYVGPGWLALSVGGLTRDNPDDTLPVESYLALGNDSIQLDVGYREHWLSPFQQSAMLLSTNARPSVSIGLSNPLPFDNWWNLHYEVFVSRLEETENIRYGDQLESGRPALLGTHLSFEPVDGWTIGLTRTMQFGGGSRKVDAGSIWDAFIDPVSNDNPTDCPEDDPNNCELGNQQAAISNRMNFSGNTPFAIYFEYAAEDTAALSNTKLGNLAVSGGFYFPFLFDGNWSFNYEFSQWQNYWYFHHIYQNGYTNDGVVMGHWGANEREFGSSAGATAQSVSIGWQTDAESRLEIAYRQIENASYAGFDYHVGKELGLRYSVMIAGFRLNLNLLAGRSVYDETFRRAEIAVQW
ncbi:hypothetical protein HPT27_10290 [Permianibacter sp. IMCC34836]|uniref:capsule assembly Wzi family protein n=1 Tax=Permianibacter fluminis TaxID=2738515 RepID=UPI00155386B2|nr:capsule assembly Wzi family protein [Permianibacter fluminis]NQD37419.1 hypothetical protein [Permianibacter fluminis]